MSYWPVSPSVLKLSDYNYIDERIKVLKFDFNFFLQRVNCDDKCDQINSNINVLIERRCSDALKIVNDGLGGFNESYFKVQNGKGEFAYLLWELAECLNSSQFNGEFTEFPKSAYFSAFGLRCLELYGNQKNDVLIFEAHKTCGYAEQAYVAEATEKQRAKDKEQRISCFRQKAARAKRAQTHDSWKPHLAKIIKNTDWTTAIQKDNRRQRTLYLMDEFQQIINEKGLYAGVNGAGPTFRWINDFLKELEGGRQ